MAARRSSSSSTIFCLGQVLECHVDHADGALDDLRARGHDGLSLLALEHRRGDLRCVGEVADGVLR